MMSKYLNMCRLNNQSVRQYGQSTKEIWLDTYRRKNQTALFMGAQWRIVVLLQSTISPARSLSGGASSAFPTLKKTHHEVHLKNACG